LPQNQAAPGGAPGISGRSLRLGKSFDEGSKSIVDGLWYFSHEIRIVLAYSDSNGSGICVITLFQGNVINHLVVDSLDKGSRKIRAEGI
jgi:hypothetical protein